MPGYSEHPQARLPCMVRLHRTRSGQPLVAGRSGRIPLPSAGFGRHSTRLELFLMGSISKASRIGLGLAPLGQVSVLAATTTFGFNPSIHQWRCTFQPSLQQHASLPWLRSVITDSINTAIHTATGARIDFAANRLEERFIHKVDSNLADDPPLASSSSATGITGYPGFDWPHSTNKLPIDDRPAGSAPLGSGSS